MSANVIVRCGLGLVAVLLLAESNASAQTGKDISVGYSFIAIDGTHFPTGGYVSFAEGRGVARAVVDFTLQRSTGRGGIATFLGGVRFAPRTRGRVTPFGQALFGFGVGGNGDLFAAWATQFGGGIDIPMQPNGPALRLGVDFPLLFNGDGKVWATRSTVGIVHSW